MDRRSLLRRGVAGAVAAVAGPSLARAVDAAPRAEVPPGELDEVSVAELRAGMERGRWTSRAIAERYLARIEEVDRGGPALRSVIETNPDALAIAEQLDRERAAGRVRGPLHGIPVLLKDNVDTADRMKTTAGSLALVDAPTPKDAFLAARLREAGALLLGK